MSNENGIVDQLKNNLKETKKDLLVGLAGCMSQEESVVDEIINNLNNAKYIVDDVKIGNKKRNLSAYR